MGNIFGKPKEQPVSRITDHDRAVLQLKKQRDSIKLELKRFEHSLERDRAKAKQLISAGYKDRALILLRKKRYKEQLIERAMGQLDNIERLITDVEQAQMQMEVVKSLEIGNDCLKRLHSLVSVEDVERIMDDTRDAVEYQRSIDELVSGALTNEDEDDILRELAELTGETEELSLPAVPDGELPSKVKKTKTEERREAVLAS